MEHKKNQDTEAIPEQQQRMMSALDEIMAMDHALLYAVVEAAGPVTVSREDISRCLREKRQVRAVFDAQQGLWQLSAREETS